MNDRNAPSGPGHDKAENYPEHTPLALIRGLPATTGAANRPELECEFRKIYTTEFPVAARAGQSERMFDRKLTLLFGI